MQQSLWLTKDCASHWPYTCCADGQPRRCSMQLSCHSMHVVQCLSVCMMHMINHKAALRQSATPTMFVHNLRAATYMSHFTQFCPFSALQNFFCHSLLPCRHVIQSDLHMSGTTARYRCPIQKTFLLCSTRFCPYCAQYRRMSV